MHVRADYPFDDVAVVSHHANDGYSNPFSNYRKNYSGITGYPTCLVNYVYRLTGTYGTWQENYNWITTRVDVLLNQRAPGTLNIIYDDNGATVDVHATFCLDEALTDNCSLWMLVYEDDVDGNGLLSQDGTTSPETVTISDPGEYTTHDWSFTVDSGWDTDELNLVAFVQKNTGDKAILQVDIVHLYLDGTDDDAPQITGQYPADGQSDIPADSPLYFHLFDQTGVNTGTLDFSVSAPDLAPQPRNNALRLGPRLPGEISGTLDVDDTDPNHVICIFTPDADLPLDTEITCTVAGGLADTMGNSAAEESWTFEVASSAVVPSSWGAIKALGE
jgi:hypothetical protein